VSPAQTFEARQVAVLFALLEFFRDARQSSFPRGYSLLLSRSTCLPLQGVYDAADIASSFLASGTRQVAISYAQCRRAFCTSRLFCRARPSGCCHAWR